MPKRNSKYRWVHFTHWYYEHGKSIFGRIHRGIDGKWVVSLFKWNRVLCQFPKTLAEGKAFIEKCERANHA